MGNELKKVKVKKKTKKNKQTKSNYFIDLFGPRERDLLA